MQISIAPVTGSMPDPNQPTFQAGEQPYRMFLSVASVARVHVDAALTLLAGPQALGLGPRDDVAGSVVEARAGVELLGAALLQEAPGAARASAQGALAALQSAISMASSPTPLPLDPDVVADLYRAALTQVDEAISHATYMFAL